MSLAHSPQIVTNGLVFAYDMDNTKKSFKGKPTTNYAYAQNPRIDSSYAAYSATSSGTWNAKHSDAIRVYNTDGSEITGYVNTGVTDWTNTYHAIWTFDPELARPVVTMRDVDGNWKAKSFGLSVSTPAAMGLTNGSTYSISWLSWTDDITKCANAGMYCGRTSDGAYSFWDGQSNSQSTAFNTKVNTWQRVYAVFTVNAIVNVNSSWSCYMYGHYGNRGTVKIADVQVETGVASGFSYSQNRSNTQALIDLTGTNTITASSLTYASDGTFSFNGSSNSITVPFNSSQFTFNSAQTIIMWMKNQSPSTTRRNPYNQAYAGGGTITHENDSVFNYYFGTGGSDNSPYTGFTSSFSVVVGETAMICLTRDASTVSWYKNGTFSNSISNPYGASVVTGTNNITIGSGYAGAFGGNIYAVHLYNRALSAAEVKQNFNALRGRYGL